MDSNRTKIMITPSNEVLAVCIVCGKKTGLPLGEWLDLDDLIKGVRHAPCASGRRGVSAAPDVLRRFFDECTIVNPTAYVSMEALRDAFDAWPGNGGRYSEYSTFGRWARQILPAGVRVERRRLDNERQNWVIGLRLK